MVRGRGFVASVGRLRWVAPVTVLVVVGSLMVSLPPAVAADPVLPPGASLTAPVQRVGSGVAEPRVSTEVTQGRRGPGVPVGDATPRHPAPKYATRLEDRQLSPREAGVEADRVWARGFAARFGGRVEVPSARTRFTAEFANPDGTSTVQVFDQPAFVADGAGGFRPVDASLSKRADGRAVPFAAASGVSFAATASDAEVGSWELGGGVSVGFGVAGAPGTPVTLDGEVARYTGVGTDSDLELSSTVDGLKEIVVLRSAAAPRSWLFPLRTSGLTPSLDGSGSVLFTDRQDRVRAAIPPGFMEDSSLDPQRGGPRSSNGVRYTVLRQGSGWALRVDLDSAWLDAPDRAWPVRVDPSFQNYAAESDDTFVSSSEYAGLNNSARTELLAGTWNGGGEKAASYLHFSAAIAALAGKTVTSATLKAYNHWSYTCVAKPSSVYKVTSAWAGGSTTSYPGPAFESTALATSTFSYGYSACPTAGWGSWALPTARVQAWVNGTEPFAGLTIRASTTDSTQWKRFRSMNASATQRPFLEVGYDNVPGIGAGSTPAANATVESLTPTLWADLVDPAATGARQYKFEVCGGTAEAPTGCVNSGGSWLTSATWQVPAGTLSWFTDYFWRANVSNGVSESGWTQPSFFTPTVPQPPVTSHLAGAAEGADVAGVNPQVGNYATAVTDATVSVVGPALAAVRTYNSQDLRFDGAFGAGWSTPWDQRLDQDPDGSGSAVVTLASGRQVRFGQNPDGSYASPEGLNLTLVYGAGVWTLRDPSGYRRVFDGSGRLVSVTDPDGRAQTFAYETTNLAVGQPATGSASCSGDETPGKAVNGSVGGGDSDKFCSEASPLWLQVDVGSVQTVSEIVVRHAEAGGEPAEFNTRAFTVKTSTDGVVWTTRATVTANTAAVTTHGFLPTPVQYARLDITTPTQSADVAARIYELEVRGGSRLTTVKDVTSGRALHLSWSGGHVASVQTDAPASGQAPSTWTYSYTGDKLTGVCTPLGGCTAYTYTASSHYRSVVLDDAPLGYWPLGESSGTVASNVAARTPNQYNGTYTSVTLGATGALAGSPDTATTFNGSSSAVTLPAGLTWSSLSLSIELWFKAGSGASGILFTQQAGTFPAATTQGAPNLYIGTDGKLRAQFWTTTGGATPITTAGTVTDNTWHHAVLTGAVNQQELYLDGTKVGEITNRTIDHLSMAYVYVGSGWNTGWPNITANTNVPFTGQIDDVAFYPHHLAPSQVAAHYAARAATTRLATVVEPGSFTASTLTYTHATGRLSTVADRNGATWTVGAPTLTPDAREVVLSSTARSPITYRYDTGHGGRMTSRMDTFGTKTWGYNDFGFVKSVTDENDNRTEYTTDDRGNVTSRTTWRQWDVSHTEYFGYYLNGSDPLDPRNDQQIWSADARSADATDLTYRTTRTLDTAGRVTDITYPKPAGQATNPTETFTYSTPPGGGHDYTMTSQARSYVDASNTLALTGDEAVQQVSLPFTFPYFGSNKTSLWISTNGFAAFTDPGSAWPGDPAATPNSGAPNDILAPFWDDIEVGVGSSVRTATLGTAPNRTFVVEWRNVHPWDVPHQRLSFEILLYENGSAIEYRYAGIDPGDTRERGASATVGLENATGTVGVVYSHQQPNVSDDLTIRFTPGGGTYTLTTTPGIYLPADATVLADQGDESLTPVTLPFPMPFYGQTQTRLWVSDNGFASFDDPGSSWPNSPTSIPAVGLPNKALYPFWDDLNLESGTGNGSIRTATVGTAPNRQFVIEWRHIHSYEQDAERITAQILLHENGTITYRYAGIDANTREQGNQATIGLENAAGTAAKQYAYHQTLLSTVNQVTFTPTQPQHPAGVLLSSTARNTAVTTYAYNSSGDRITTTDPVGLVTTNTYDNLGRPVTKRTSATVLGSPVDYGTSTYTYNGLSLPVTITEPGINNPISNVTHTKVITLGYDSAGRTTSQAVSDATGGDTTRTTTTVYDPAGRLTSTTAPDNSVTAQTWSAAGNIATVTKPGGLVLNYTYDDAHRLLTTTATGSNVDPMNAGATSLVLDSRGYDPAGRLAVTTDAMGRTTRYTYWRDNLEMLAYLDRVEPVPDVFLRRTSYDEAGHPTFVRTAGGVVTNYTYDPAGNVATQAHDPSGLNRITTTSYNLDSSVHHTTANTAAPIANSLSRHHLATALTASCNVNEGPEKAVNDSTTGGNTDKWCSNGAGTKTLQVDLGQQTSITSFTVKHAGAGGEQASWNTRDFTIQVSPDAAAWTTPVTVTANTADETTHTVTTGGRYVRLNITTPTQDGNTSARIYDFTVTGTIGPQASPGRTERVDYTYDPAGRNLTTTVDPTGLNLITSLVRDPRGLITRETDPAGTITTHTYDLAGRSLSTTGAARDIWVNATMTAAVQPITTLGRNTFGDVTHQRDPNSQTTTMAYDPMSRPLSTTQPGYTPPGGSLITATSSTTYNAQGLPTTQTDALGNVTTTTYNKYGHALTVTEPDPDAAGPKTAPATTMEYSRNGELLKTTDPIGGQTLATYDELGRAITDTVSDRPSGTPIFYTTTLAYNNAGDAISTSTPLGHVTAMEVNNAGEVVRTTDPTGRFTHASYDLAGRVVSTVAGQNSTYANPVTTNTYDLAGRRTSTSDCTATGAGACDTVLRTSTTGYNGANQVTQQTTAEGRPTFYAYNAAGQLTSVTQRTAPATPATAITVNLGYDRNGNQTRRLDGNGNATTYTYTPWNLAESVIEPSTTAHPNAADRTWTNVYNAAGWLTEQHLPGGVTRTSTYDKLGRQTAETATGATTTARSLDYDAAGRTTSASSPAGNHTYTWTDRGGLATATGYGGTATYTYDSDNRLTGRTDAAGAATFGYDDADRITSIVDPLTATTATNGYDTAGRLSTVTHGAGKSTRDYTYDTLGRVATDTTKKPDTTTAASITYGYDNDGLLTSKTTVGLTGAGANTYGYDGLGRVTSWLNPGGTTTTYGYDAASNRTTVTTPAGTRTSTFDQRNRLTGTTGASLPADSYTWSPRGTLATATKAGVTTTYTFDGFERLTQAQKSPGYTVTFTYDSLDRPAQRGAANFGYNNLDNDPILSPTAAGEAKLLRQPDGDPLSTKTGAATGALLLQDQVHGDIAATADMTTGLPSASADYDPWGTTTSTSGTLPLGYQGGWTDYEAALVNAHARWYDSAFGTFASRDTLTLPPDPIAQGNRYLYANGSPLTSRDPDGHRATTDNNGQAVFDPRAPRTSIIETCLNRRVTLYGVVTCGQPPPPWVPPPTWVPPTRELKRASPRPEPALHEGCVARSDCGPRSGPPVNCSNRMDSDIVRGSEHDLDFDYADITCSLTEDEQQLLEQAKEMRADEARGSHVTCLVLGIYCPIPEMSHELAWCKMVGASFCAVAASAIKAAEYFANKWFPAGRPALGSNRTAIDRGRWNAFHHAMWFAILGREGLDAHAAALLGVAHELDAHMERERDGKPKSQYVIDYGSWESKIDMHNNMEGFFIGKRYDGAGPSFTNDDLALQVFGAVAKGAASSVPGYLNLTGN